MYLRIRNRSACPVLYRKERAGLYLEKGPFRNSGSLVVQVEQLMRHGPCWKLLTIFPKGSPLSSYTNQRSEPTLVGISVHRSRIGAWDMLPIVPCNQSEGESQPEAEVSRSTVQEARLTFQAPPRVVGTRE